MMIKATTYLVAFTTLALVASACSGGSNGASEGTATPSGSSSGDTTACLDGAPSLEEMKIKDGLFVASSLDFEPFEFVEDGKPSGFDIDLVNAIAKKLCAPEPQITNIGFDTVIPQVQSGQQTLGVSAITITDERKETVAFSKPYFNADQSLLVASDSTLKGVNDLTADLRVGVAAGTTGELWAKEHVTDASIQSFPTTGAAFQALTAGQIDAVINDKTVTAEQEALGNGKIVETIDTGESYGIAVQKGNDALVTGIDMAIDALKESGEYDTIYSTYFKGAASESPSE
ncbi:basic amino acid ABC transporter substrate-binding protein [Stomatohabitans albus]|uniref:basic amino acid ABC transporter substrate-binding protein n=1 Tax=Stomatohabitans albus TaxID=3110766 RepID=UPI00300D39DF